MSENKSHILFLPEWYPNPEDPQLGVFVQKHARAAAQYANVSLVYCGPFAKGDSIELYHKTDLGFDEYFCYYPKSIRKYSAFHSFLEAHRLCYAKIREDKGVPEIAHLHMLFRNYLAWKKIYRHDINRYIVTEQWSGYLNGTYETLPFWKKMYYRRALTQTKIVTAVSSKLAKALTNKFKPQNQIIILPNVAEKSDTTIVKTTNSVYLLVVADLVDEIKNISDVIQAYLLAEIPQPSILTIVGDGPDRKKLEDLAATNQQSDKQILFTGRLHNEHVLDIMSKNHFLITNSRHETFSMVTAEALLTGLPVICTRCGGPEEFVNDSNGILIPVDSRPALIRAIEKMGISYRDYSAENLSKPVLERFGIEAIGLQLKKIYASIL